MIDSISNELNETKDVSSSMLTNEINEETDSLAHSDSYDEFALTTTDNPFNPFTNFIEWNAFDVEKGYNSCCYLARIAKTKEDMSEKEYNDEVERAIDEIVFHNITGNYIKIKNTHEKNDTPVL